MAEAAIGPGTSDKALRVTLASDSSGLDGGGAEAPIQGAVEITPSDTVFVAAGRMFRIVCTAAGNVKVKYADGSTDTFPVEIGLTRLPDAVIQVFVTGTTATASYANLL